MNSPDVLQTYPELHQLADLKTRGWLFQPVFNDGELEAVTGVRLWPHGWCDALAIHSEAFAHAFRRNPTGGEVWRRQGGSVEVLDALIELVSPFHPQAPRLVRGPERKLWVPGQE